MADYQSLLTRAVANLPSASAAAARQAIYDRARTALVTQLRSLRPPLPESDIEREERALDKAIAQVEAQFAPSETSRGEAPAAPAVRRPRSLRRPPRRPPTCAGVSAARPETPPTTPAHPRRQPAAQPAPAASRRANSASAREPAARAGRRRRNSRPRRLALQAAHVETRRPRPAALEREPSRPRCRSRRIGTTGDDRRRPAGHSAKTDNGERGSGQSRQGRAERAG